MITRRGVLIGGGAAALIDVGRSSAQTTDRSKEFRMDMYIKRNGSRPSQMGSQDWFTGAVRVDPLFQPQDPARAGAGQVTFEPAARPRPSVLPVMNTIAMRCFPRVSEPTL